MILTFSARNYLRTGALWLLGLCAAIPALAQFPTTPTNTGRPADAGDLFGGQGDFGADSLGTDSSRLNLNIKPDTKFFDPEALFRHRPFLFREGITLEESMIFDPVERIDGFVQSLGQIGKPYNAYLFGLQERYFDLPLWRDPVLGHYNRYTLDASQVRYYDTRTPYVDIWFAQGGRQLQVVDVTFSRSFGPSLNLTGKIRRPQSVGAYRSFVTDHTQVYVSGHYQSKKDRYHAFSNVTLNRQNNQLNGGVPRNASANEYPMNDGLIREVGTAYNLAFFKENFSPLLDAQLVNRSTAAYLDHFYHLFGHADADTVTKKHRLTLRNTIRIDWDNRRYFDTGIDTTRLKQNLVPVMPTLAPGVNAVEDSFSVRRFLLSGGVSYSWLLASGWQANASGGVNLQRIAWRGDSATVNQNITEQFGDLRLSFPGGYLRADVRQRVSNQFAPEQKLNAEFALGLFGGGDSLRISGEPTGAIQFRANAMVGNLNPSLFQKTWQGGIGNAYRGNDSLRNEQLLHGRASIRWQPEAPIRNGDTLLPHSVSVGAFYSSRQNPVLYTPSFEVIQGAQGITRLGLTTHFRVRFLRHMHFETNASYVPRISTSADETTDLYLRSVPVVNGRSSIYFDHRDLDIAREFRLGIGANYWTAYAGQTLEPISGQFFPTNYEVIPFTAADAFFQLNLHGVMVFFRYTYLNENLLYNGYFSTPFYPMLERTFMLGIKWTFFD